MKVIGMAGTESFLLQAEGDEVAKMLGYHSLWYAERDGHRVKVGDVFEITKTCGALPGLRQDLAALSQTSERLRSLADRVDSLSANLYSPLRKPPEGETKKG